MYTWKSHVTHNSFRGETAIAPVITLIVDLASEVCKLILEFLVLLLKLGYQLLIFCRPVNVSYN